MGRVRPNCGRAATEEGYSLKCSAAAFPSVFFPTENNMCITLIITYRAPYYSESNINIEREKTGTKNFARGTYR